MPYQPIGKYESQSGFTRKTDFKRPVTFFDRVRFVGPDSSMEIFGGVITGGISADIITSGTIYADRLVLRSGDNMVDDPNFEEADAWVLELTGGGDWTWGNTAAIGTELRYDTTNQSTIARVHAFDSSCIKGDVYVATVTIWAHANSTGSARLLVSEFKADGTWNGVVSFETADLSAANNVTLTVEKTITQTDTEHVRFEITVQEGADAFTYVTFRNASLRRKVGSLVIEDQAVDIERQLNPVFVDGGEDKSGVTLKFAGQTDVHTTSTITVPSWVGTLTVFAVGMFHNRWGFSQRVDLYVKIAGGPATQATNTDVIANEVNATIGADAKNISSPGSTIKVEITGGTNSNDELTVNVQSVYTATGLR